MTEWADSARASRPCPSVAPLSQQIECGCGGGPEHQAGARALRAGVLVGYVPACSSARARC